MVILFLDFRLIEQSNGNESNNDFGDSFNGQNTPKYDASQNEGSTPVYHNDLSKNDETNLANMMISTKLEDLNNFISV